jgi:Flp pilus assembly protein TadG
MLLNRKQPPIRRRGTATVEFAALAPLILTMILGGIELGRCVMVKHVLEEAARAGCRVVTLHEGTKQDAIAIVDLAMQSAGISGYTITFTPDPPTSQAQLTPVKVTVSVPHSQIAWLTPKYLAGSTLSGDCIMPAERDVSATKRTKEATKRAKAPH